MNSVYHCYITLVPITASVQQKSEESGEIKIKSLAEIRREKLLKAKQSASKSEVDHNGAQTSKETPAVKPGLDSGLG